MGAFQSMLFIDGTVEVEGAAQPSTFRDLNLDQIVDEVVVGREIYRLKPYFYTELPTVDAVQYRHDIMRDLEQEPLFDAVRTFGRRLAVMRDYLQQVNKLHYPRQKQAWFVEAVTIYCAAVQSMVSAVAAVDIKSRGFQRFLAYAVEYVGSDSFRVLAEETKVVLADLSSIQYSLSIKGLTITVGPDRNEPDYRHDVNATFERFRKAAAVDYAVKFSEHPEMNHVEARILDLVARLYPEPFRRLDTYCERYRESYLDSGITQFDREVQFYLAYREFMQRLARKGLSFCYPAILTTTKDIQGEGAFDLALAAKLAQGDRAPVLNSFYLQDPERMFVITGPNQGGKTTFARMVGQLHYLAKLGCPVPGQHARLFFYDRIFTHFEREEQAADLQGKLTDDLVRIHEILTQATGASLIILNEIFSSTTLQDALYLGQQIIGHIINKDTLAIVVTFIEEWAGLSDKTVSLVSAVAPESPAVRTFKIVRRSPDGRSYAQSIAEKYGLTYERIKERIGR